LPIDDDDDDDDDAQRDPVNDDPVTSKLRAEH
jgi:hypothetical protein